MLGFLGFLLQQGSLYKLPTSGEWYLEFCNEIVLSHTEPLKMQAMSVSMQPNQRPLQPFPKRSASGRAAANKMCGLNAGRLSKSVCKAPTGFQGCLHVRDVVPESMLVAAGPQIHQRDIIHLRLSGQKVSSTSSSKP